MADIVVKITSEADLTDAQLQLRDLTEKTKEYEKQMEALKKAELDDIAAVKARIAAGKENESELQAVINYNKELQKEKQKEINASKQSIEILKKEVKAYNSVQGAGKKMSQQLRQMREELQRMEDAGEGTTKEFVDLAVAAARLQDQIGDTQQRIAVLASDTRNLDAAMSVTDGLAGAFNVATSAMALFGGESEELEKAFYKVQNVMSVLNGLQQVANVLNKDSAAMIMLNTAYEKLRARAMGQATAATIAETTAQTALNTAMKVNPVLALIGAISALVVVFNKLSKASKDLEDRERKRAEAIKEQKIEEQTKNLENYNNALEREARLKERLAGIKYGGDDVKVQAEMLKYYKEQLQEVNEQLNDQYKNKERSPLYSQMLALEKQLDELTEGTDEYLMKVLELVEVEDKYNKTLPRTAEEMDQLRERQKQLKQQIEETNAALEEAKILSAAQKAREALEEQKRKLEEQKQLIKEIAEAEQSRWTNAALERMGDQERELYELDERMSREQAILDAAYEKNLISKEEYERRDQEITERYAQQNEQIVEKYLQREREAEEQANEERLRAEEEFSEKVREIREREDDEYRKHIEDVINITSQAMQAVADIFNSITDGITSNIQAQIDALDEMYTTDAEEAQENADKKYITEQELARKKAMLELRSARLQKANSILSIGLSTAQAIMAALADQTLPSALKWAQVALVSATGATQLAVAASKPLSQYATGRNGGPGEYALVGERGPEIMYVPKGASIVPNDKLNNPGAWGQYGVPAMTMPDMPNVSLSSLDDFLTIHSLGGAIDYDKLGRAVASAMPAQKSVSVNIDRNGIVVSDTNGTHTHLNHKYSGTWN